MHFTFRVMHYGLLVLKNQCLIYMYYVLLFFDNVFFSYQIIIAPTCF